MRSPATRYQNNTSNEIHIRGLKSENGTLCLMTRALECDTYPVDTPIGLDGGMWSPGGFLVIYLFGYLLNTDN